jgi:phage repressor protein C with HTH and peptisase S24 domain
MDWNRRLTQARIAKGMNKSEFAKQIGVSNPTVTQWENGTIRTIAGPNLMRVCEVLGITSEWLFFGDKTEQKEPEPSQGVQQVRMQFLEETDPAFVPIRMVRLRLSAGIMGFRTEPDYEADALLNMSKRWLERNGYFPENLIAIRVRGESMEPTLYHDDIVVINTADTSPLDGAVFAINYEGEAVVKRFTRDAGDWWLTSDNPDHRKYPRKLCRGNECMIVGRVVWREGSRI